MNKDWFESVVSNINYKGWHFFIGDDAGRLFMQIRVFGLCNVNGVSKEWTSRKWFLSSHMTKSEVVQTAFLAVLTAEEHEARERFLYIGRSIFDPHYNVDLLWSLRGTQEAREVR